MSDPSRYLDPGDDAAVGPARESDAGPPRWVKISGIAAIILVLLFVIMLLSGVGGEHGPSRHSQSGDGVGPSSSSAAGPGVGQL
ncbi:MAG: hypothetical protein WKF51_10860 [Geodermatophilaceae bacterium]